MVIPALLTRTASALTMICLLSFEVKVGCHRRLRKTRWSGRSLSAPEEVKIPILTSQKARR